jgi:hypothetical protein
MSRWVHRHVDKQKVNGNEGSGIRSDAATSAFAFAFVSSVVGVACLLSLHCNAIPI